jgi:hypothetical protein
MRFYSTLFVSILYKSNVLTLTHKPNNDRDLFLHYKKRAAVDNIQKLT